MSRPPEFHYEPAADDFSPSHQALQYTWSVGIMGEHRMTRFGGTYWTGRGHGRRSHPLRCRKIAKYPLE